MPLKPSDYASIILVSSPSISPSGDTVLFLRTRTDLEKNTYYTQVWIAGRDREPSPLTRESRITCVKWAPSGSLAAFTSNDRPGKKQDEKGAGIWLLRPGGEPWFLAWFRNGVSRLSWFPDSKRILVQSSKGEVDEDVKVIDRIPFWADGAGFIYSLRRRLYIVYTDSGSVEEVEIPIDDNADILFGEPSPDGRRILYILRPNPLHPLDNELHIYNLDTCEDISLLRKPMRIVEARWSPDGESIAFIGHHRERGVATHYRVWIIGSRREKQSPRPLDEIDRNHANFMNSDSRGPRCQDSLWWDRWGNLYYVMAEGGEVVLAKCTPGSEPSIIIRGGVVDEFSVSPHGDIAFTYMEASHPNELYLYSSGKTMKLTGFNDGVVARWGLRRPEKIVFQASDGELVEGWVLPPYTEEEGSRKAPAILEIHGGPKTAYGEGFMFEFHMLASNGYYVIYCNPRGSDGYSQDFADIRGRWGERDYRDLMEFVDAVLKRYPEIDGDRLGVVGGSYGGFMVNWIVGHTKRFKAAVTQRSISLWFTSFGATDIGYYFDPDEIGGYPWENPDAYIEKSPLMYVENIKTPLLIIHSINDYRCHMVEALQLFTALKVLEKEARLVLFPEEGHDLSRSGKPRHRAERLKYIIDWLDKHLKPSGGEE